MSGHGFTSAFATELDAYLAFKANMGFTGASRIWYLKQFDTYCAAHDRTVFDKDTVEGWVGVVLQRCGRYRSWMSYIRDLGRWMTMNAIPDAYVLSDRWKAPFVAAHPYLDPILLKCMFIYIYKKFLYSLGKMLYDIVTGTYFMYN